MRVSIERFQRTEVQVVALVLITAIVLLLHVAGAPRPAVVLAAVLGVAGFLAAAQWLRRTQAAAVVPEGAAEPDEDEDAPQTEQMIYVATPSTHSSTTRRLLRIGSHTAPMSPPDLEIQLMVEDWDAAARLPVEELPTAELRVSEMLPRIAQLVEQHRPTDYETRFVLSALRSEGPVDSSGLCSWGWTFYFVDGRFGIGCAATLTPYDLSLQYHSAPTYEATDQEVRPDVAHAVSIARRELPELQQLPLWVRFHLPADHLVYHPSPLWIVDVDAAGDAVRNTTSLRRRMSDASEPDEKWTIDDLLAWARGDQFSCDDLERALRDEGFADGLRINAEDALRRSGLALWRAHGAEASSIVYGMILSCDTPDVANDLTAVLAHIPSGLATAALHRLSETATDEDVRRHALTLFDRRRTRRLSVPPDPIDRLNFVESRRAMGKSARIEPLPLRSVYDENELFEALAEIGLHVTRRRIVSGEFPVLHGAWLRGARGDIEGLISSNALPVPCHVLHLAGGAADAFIQRIEAAGLVYAEEAIRTDACSHKPHHVHRAALYLSALRRDWPDCVPSMLDVLERGRADINLRRAILHALEHIHAEQVEPALTASAENADDRLAQLARDILERRARAARAATPSETPDA